MQSAHAYHDARETFAKLGVRTAEPHARLRDGRVVEGRGRRPDDRRHRVAVQGERRRVGQRQGHVHGPEHDRGRGRARRSTSRARSSRRGRSRCARRSPGSTRPAASTRPGSSRRPRCLRRLVVLGGGIIGCEFASIFNRFGTEVTIIEMLPHLIPTEDEDAAKELEKAFRKRGIAQHLSKQCTQVDDHGSHLTVHFGEGETVDCDLMLVSVGRAALVDGLGLEAAGVAFDRKGIGDRRPPPHERAAHLRRRRRRGLLAARAHRLPRGRGRGGERDGARGDDRRARRAAADLHRPRDRRRRAHRGPGARAARRRRRRRPRPVGRRSRAR